jgi:predicted ATPase/class 3 adenylate cyclase
MMARNAGALARSPGRPHEDTSVSDPSSPSVPGVFAFLFTDIEGSTRLWEAQPRAMGIALARHDAILRAAIEVHDGRVFKTVGDAFCAAFGDPLAALLAAADAQRGLAAEAWSGVPPILVRMAIHVGSAEERDGDFFGQTLNRASRLLALAHGGQVLLSGNAANQCRERLPADAAMRDLGDHPLKDLREPERVAQLLAPGLRESFPALRGGGEFRHTIPEPPTALIGRDAELDAARTALGVPSSSNPRPLGPSTPPTDAARLLTLTGPGGAGKTRLAIAIAAELGPFWADGAAFVPLAHVTDARLVPQEIAARLGFADIGPDPQAALTDALRERSLLLVLDNLEQVVESAGTVAELLGACPRLTVLATSRERLRLRGERELALPPLALPEPGVGAGAGAGGDIRASGGDRAGDDVGAGLGAGAGAGARVGTGAAASLLEAARSSPAVQLFVERAASVRPGFALNAETAPAVIDLCRALDGLPLAIELVAARSRLLSPTALLQRFDRRLDLLSGGARDLPPRHRAMRDTIAWSVDLLDTAERDLFARLSVFAAGASLDAVEGFAVEESRGRGVEEEHDDARRTTHDAPLVLLDSSTPRLLDSLDSLDSLADKSLVRIVDGSGGEPRVAMLETIRAYAGELLEASGGAAEAKGAHARFFLDLARDAAAKLEGPEQRAWLDRLDTEHPNLRAALSWLIETGDAACAVQLAGSLWRFWWLRGWATEGREWLRRVLALPGTVDPRARVAALNGAGILAEATGDRAAAQTLHEEALREARADGDASSIAWSLDNLGVLAVGSGDFERAGGLLEEAVRLAETTGDLGCLATSLNDLGLAAKGTGDATRANQLLDRALALFRRMGNQAQAARALNNLGVNLLYGGDPDGAQPMFAEALRSHRALGDRPGIAATLNNLAQAAHAIGESESALALYLESYAVAIEAAVFPYAAIARENAAALARERGDLRFAEEAYREALDLNLRTGDQAGIEASLVGLATVELDRGDLPAAARLIGAAGAPGAADSSWLSVDPSGTSVLEAVRMALNPADFARLLQQGRETPVAGFGARGYVTAAPFVADASLAFRTI